MPLSPPVIRATLFRSFFPCRSYSLSYTGRGFIFSSLLVCCARGFVSELMTYPPFSHVINNFSTVFVNTSYFMFFLQFVLGLFQDFFLRCAEVLTSPVDVEV